MVSPLASAAAFLLLLILSVAELVAAWHALRKRRWVKTGISAPFGMTLLALAALAGTIGIATRGYRTVSEEERAATIKTELLRGQRFRATIILPGGRLAMYDLTGDAFAVEGYIVKWHPFVSNLGVHPAYEIDRIVGRYNSPTDERTKPHAVYSLARPKWFTMFDVVKHVPLLAPLVDAEYASASGAVTARPATFDVFVTPTGFLIRLGAP